MARGSAHRRRRHCAGVESLKPSERVRHRPAAVLRGGVVYRFSVPNRPAQVSGWNPEPGIHAGATGNCPLDHTTNRCFKKYERLAVLLVALCSYPFARWAGNYLFLFLMYGFSRVSHEGLHFVQTAQIPWLVSNGDRIDRPTVQTHAFLIFITWMFTTISVYAFLWKLLPECKNAVVSPAGQSTDARKPQPMPLERRPLAKKGRPLLTYPLAIVACWIPTTLILIMTARWIGAGALVLILGAGITLVVIRARARMRYLMMVITTTPCPKCAQGPLRYQISRVKNDQHNLLVCDRCHIEWDLGRF
jgi:hypothetical protein